MLNFLKTVVEIYRHSSYPQINQVLTSKLVCKTFQFLMCISLQAHISPNIKPPHRQLVTSQSARDDVGLAYELTVHQVINHSKEPSSRDS
jgi:hypothetical protein